MCTLIVKNANFEYVQKNHSVRNKFFNQISTIFQHYSILRHMYICFIFYNIQQHHFVQNCTFTPPTNIHTNLVTQLRQLLNIKWDIHFYLSEGIPTVPILLNLSATFNITNNPTFFHRLSDDFVPFMVQVLV